MTSQGEVNAAEILADIKDGTGKFREDTTQTVWCTQCPPKRGRQRLVRVFYGPDDDGTVHTWLLTARYKRNTRHMPAEADAIPPPSAPGFVRLTMCPRCSSGWVIWPRETTELTQLRADDKPVTIYFRHGDEGSWQEPWAVGDDGYGVTGSEWADGPGTAVRLRIDTPVFATVRR